jgi:hypothetical protein
LDDSGTFGPALHRLGWREGRHKTRPAFVAAMIELVSHRPARLEVSRAIATSAVELPQVDLSILDKSQVSYCKEITMGLFDELKSVFLPGTPDPPDASRLKGESVTALAASLKSLAVGRRGWITLREAWHLFSPVDDQAEAFGELDDEGRKRLEDFAAEASYRSGFNYMPVEGRLYFTRN